MFVYSAEPSFWDKFADELKTFNDKYGSLSASDIFEALSFEGELSSSGDAMCPVLITRIYTLRGEIVSKIFVIFVELDSFVNNHTASVMDNQQPPEELMEPTAV